MKKSDALKAIQEEIRWCRENMPAGHKFGVRQHKSFIAGLRQAKRLIAAIPVQKGGRKHVENK